MEDVGTFYNRYAKEAGFSIRSHTSAKSKDNTTFMRKEYVSYKQGYSKVQGEKRKRGLAKVGCKAIIAAVRKKSGGYAIYVFVEGHNHPLTSPARVPFLKSHCRISKVDELLSEQLSLVNVKRHKQFELFGVQTGGIENIGFTQRDLYNYGSTVPQEKEKKGRDLYNYGSTIPQEKEKKGHDGDLLYMHFLNEKEKDSSFVYRLESNKENRVTRRFWADSISRRAYSFYGDVFIFDTTYNTNRYGMIFAPLTGVNNHGQTIIFACTFLNEFSKKLDAVKYQDYYQDFHSCIWNPNSGDEFDSRWTEIVENSGLSDNKWLESIYRIRSSWIPTHVNHCFLAGMSSSQRVESQHAFFKNYVSESNSLVEFMVQFK